MSDAVPEPEEQEAPAQTPEEASSVGETQEHEDTPVAVEAASSETTESEKNENPPEMSESQAMTAPAPKPAEFTGDENLISADAGASVSNAFSTLTHTILSQNARTLDDLVSDMLQPMLKEWLDENLPTLVERMVKQEIDRMARGGRV